MNVRIGASMLASLCICICICVSFMLAPVSQALSASPSHNHTVTTNTVLTIENEQAAISHELRRFAAVVIQNLSQHPPFTPWQESAAPIIEPLGPGTHSWLVTIPDQEGNTNSSASGYLIISVTANGEYKLIEYGIGPDSIYAKATLEHALTESGIDTRKGDIIPLYSGPVLAAWTIRSKGTAQTDIYWDAVTGELLPENEASWNIQASAYIPPDSALGSKGIGGDTTGGTIGGTTSGTTGGTTSGTTGGTSGGTSGGTTGGTTTWFNSEPLVHESDSFDPYDNIMWMTSAAINVNKESFESIINTKKRLVFVTTGNNRTYSIPLPIYGYQKWTYINESASTFYLMSGTTSSPRFISIQALTDSGHFINYE